jgi:hypothetical protein
MVAADLLHDLGESGVIVQIDSEAGERLRDRFPAVIAYRRHTAAIEILQNHALEKVVDIRLGKGEIDAGIALDFAATGEVADAAVEEDYSRHRQRGSRFEILFHLDGGTQQVIDTTSKPNRHSRRH